MMLAKLSLVRNQELGVCFWAILHIAPDVSVPEVERWCAR